MVGDGFQEDASILNFRAATQHLARFMMSGQPFCHYKDALNIYRVDVRNPNQAVIPNGPNSLSSLNIPQNTGAFAPAPSMLALQIR